MTAEATASRRRATGRTLLILSALGAAGFAGWSLAQLQLATSETFLSQAWHALGLIVFAGLFALVAWRPRAYPGLMELTIVHSIGMFVLAFTNQNAAGATATMILHGLLAAALLVGYVVLGCVKAWGRQPGAAQPAAADAGRSGSARESGRGAGRESGRGAASSPHTAAEGTAPGVTGESAKQSRRSAPENAPRLDRSPEAPQQPGGQPGAQPTRRMPQELPEDRPRG